MKDERKTKAQLIDELNAIKQRLNKLEKLEQTYNDFNFKMSHCEEKYKFFLSNMNDLIVKVDREGRFLYASPSYCDVFGKTEEELIGNNFMPLVHEEDQETTRISFESTFTAPYKSYIEQRAYTKNGWRWFEWHDKAELNEHNEVVAIIGVGKDITERKLAEENLNESESILKTLVNSLPLNIILKDTESRIKYVNKYFSQFFNKPPEELIGKTLYDIYPQELAEKYRETDLQVINSGNTIENFEDHISSDSKPTKIEVIRSPFFNNSGKIQGIISISWDITEQKKAEEELIQSRALLKESQKIAHVGHYVFNAQTGNWISSDTLDSIFGIDERFPKNIEGWNNLLHPDCQDELIDYLTKFVIKEHHIFDKEYKIIRQTDKQTRWVHGLGKLKFDENGNTVEMFGTIQDITERKIIQLALEESETKFRTFFENTYMGIYRTSPDGKILLANNALIKMLGFSSIEELVERNLEDSNFDPGYDRKSFKYEMEVHGKVIGNEVKWQKKDGGFVWVRENAVAVRDKEGRITHYDGTVENITERKIAEDALKESEKRFRLLAENSTDLISRHSPDGKYIYTSPSFEKILGYKAEELYGKNPFDFLHKDDVEKVLLSLNHIISSKDIFTVESRFRKNDGNYTWLETTSKAIFDSVSEELIEIQTASRVITERKLNEIALKESEQLYRSLIDASPDAILVLDLFGNIRFLSNKTAELFEADNPEKFIGLNAFQWLEEKDKALKNFNSIINGNNQVDTEYHLYTTKNKKFIGEINASVLLDADDNSTGLVVTIRDITERKKVEDLLLQTQFSVDNARDAIFWINEDGSFIYVNDSACNSLGYTKEELLKMKTMDIDSNFDLKTRKELWDKVQREGSSIFETTHKRKEGTTFPVEIASNILNFRDQRYNCTFVRDITERKKAEIAIKESEERFRSMLQSVPTVAVQGYRSDGTIYYWNKASEEFYGYTAEEAIGKNLLDTIIPDEMKDDVRAAFKSMVETGESIPSGELSLKRKDGTRIMVYSSHSVVIRPGQEPELFCIDIDISERKEIEDKLKIMAEMLDNAPSLIMIHDYNGKIYYANKETCKAHGYELEELLKLKIMDIDTPECVAAFDDKSSIVDEQGEAIFEVTHIRKDGSIFPVEIFAKKVLWGDIPVVISIGADITERKKTQELLHRTQESVDKARDSIFWIDENGNLVYVNDAACKSLQYSKEELLKMNVIDFDPDVTTEKVNGLWEKVMSSGSLTFETRHKRKDGSTFPIEISCYKLSYGGTNYNCTFVRDITERKEAEEALRKSEHLFNTLAQISPVGIFRTRPDGKTTYVNPKWCLLSGLNSEEAMDDNWVIAVHPDDREKILSGWKDKTRRSDASNAEYRFLHQDGKIIWVMGQAIPEFSKDNQIIGYVGTITDITEQKLIEQALRENEEKFRTIIEQATEGFVLVDNRGNIVEWNNAMAQFTNMNRAQVIDKKYSEVMYNLIPEDVRSTITKDVLEIPVNELKEKGNSEYFTKSVNLSIAQDNGELVHIKQNLFPIRINNVDHIGFLITDITDQINTSRLIENYIKVLETKNAELERFTYTVSHDLKSPVITIKGFLGMLVGDAREGKFDRMEQDIKRISNAADKMQNLLDDLLQLSRIGRIVNPSVQFSMTEVANETIELLQGSIQQKNIKVIVQEDMPVVKADRTRISEVYQNLIENAIKYIGDKQQNPIIEIGCNFTKEKVDYYVKDNGIGIRKEYQEKIFGLFEKLDPNSEGTGIGLAFVKRIIELHEGKIWVESEGDFMGSTFYFYINSPKIN